MAKTLGRITVISVACAGFAAQGCKKEEPPPPLPTAAPVVTTAAPLQLKAEDAGVKLPPDAGVKKKVGTGTGGGSLSACCAALAQNATLQPTPEMKNALTYAAAACSAAAAQGKDKSSAMGLIMGALRGAGLPTACR
jgi:hypothetical protein